MERFLFVVTFIIEINIASHSKILLLIKNLTRNLDQSSITKNIFRTRIPFYVGTKPHKCHDRLVALTLVHSS